MTDTEEGPGEFDDNSSLNDPQTDDDEGDQRGVVG
jgi:hypothetical protein